METVITIAIIVIIIGSASFYIYKAKKKGNKCIGCPYADTCGKNCSGSSSCKL